MSQKRTEVYDLVDHLDHFVKTGTKQEAQKKRLFTRSVHVFIFNKRGELFVGRRSSQKKNYPNQISSSAGGHVDRGENYHFAAKRELQEELHLSVSLREIGRFDVTTNKERTIHCLFTGVADKVIPDTEEFSGYGFQPLASLFKDVQNHPRRYTKTFALALQYYNQEPVVIIDFDHTLFNWYAFKKALRMILKKDFNISEKIFKKAQEQIEKQGDLYNFNAHLVRIASLTGTSHRRVQAEAKKLSKSLPSFLFPDAKILLQKLKKSETETVLLSHGDKKNQLFFIRGTKVQDYSHKIVITKTKLQKKAVLKKLLRIHQKVIFVNDDPHESALVLHDLSRVQAFLIERPNTKYTLIPPSDLYHVIRKLTEIPNTTFKPL